MPNRGPAAFIPFPIPALIGCRGLCATSCLAVGWVDRVAAPVAVAALGDIRNDQFVVDSAPERSALRLSLFDSALACHHTGARRAWTISCR